MYLANSSQIRQADRMMIEGHGFPGILLMETAGRKAAEHVLKRFPAQSLYLILAGPGNNGGDGLVIARYLHLAGKTVQLCLSHPPEDFKGDAALAFAALGGSDIPIALWAEATLDPSTLPHGTLLIDALLGTGIHSEFRPPISDILRAFRTLDFPTVAIDLPSGLDANTGAVLNTPLSADLTLTFQCPKICHFTHPAASHCGEVITVDIGIWPSVLESLGIRRFLTTPEVLHDWHQPRHTTGHKGSYGHALLIGGSAPYAGAIALAAHAALHLGAGLSTAFLPHIAREAVHALGPEVMLLGQAGDQIGPAAIPALEDTLSNKAAVGIGPGLGQGPDQYAFLQTFLQVNTLPLVLDADALNLLATYPDLWQWIPENSILTPHPGEMRRLQPQPDPLQNRLEAAEALAQHRKVIVVLKGAGTLIASPDGQTWVNPTGNPGMGTGGTGDVLTGAIVGLLAQGYAPLRAAAMGVYLHGLAGDRVAEQLGQEGITASLLMHHLAPALHSILQNNSTT